MKIKVLSLALAVSLPFMGCDVLTQLPTTGGTASGGITQQEAASGIKQALQLGLNQGVQSLSAKDGFLGNAAVKILLPEEVRKVEQTLRTVGLGSVYDDLILSLNRAAETAVSEAKPVFTSALTQLTIRDAFNILLSGQQDAATQFFKRTTSGALFDKFSPIVDQALGQHQVAKYWNSVISTYNRLPLGAGKIEEDLNRYVTEKAIQGLFFQVAQEELKIRENFSGSRSTPLVQKVFDYADRQKN